MSAALELEPVQRLKKDIIKAAVELSPDEARFLVGAYYTIQDARIRSNNQSVALEKDGKPNAVIAYLRDQDETLEGQIKRALDKYSDSHPVGAWAKSITGIGPVIAAGLISYVRMEVKKRKPVPEGEEEPEEPEYETLVINTAGKLWRYAGLDPTQKREKGKKLGYDPEFKTLCWKMGESWVKTKNLESDVYGHMYDQRKEYEQAKNEAGEYAEQAKNILASKNFSKSTEAYKWYSKGKLPPGHIHARAKRWVVKIFLSHFHTVFYWQHFGSIPPKPFVIAHLGHVDYFMPPNLHLFPGLEEALRKQMVAN